MGIAGRIMGGIVLVAGFVVRVLGMLALADPAGARMTNDADPFGTPPGAIQPWAHVAAGAATTAAGAWLVLRRWPV